MLAVARPQLSPMQDRCSGNEGVANLQAVTLAILTEIIASLAACLIVDRDTKKRTKELRSRLMLAR